MAKSRDNLFDPGQRMKFIACGRTNSLAAGDQFQRAPGYLLHRPQPTKPLVPAGEHPLFRADELRAARLELCGVFLRGLVQPHLAVHGGGQEHFGLGIERQRDASQGVIRQTMGEFGEHIRGGGRDQQQVGLIGQLDVRRLPTLFLIV
jgi:hypothetical protein